MARREAEQIGTKMAYNILLPASGRGLLEFSYDSTTSDSYYKNSTSSRNGANYKALPSGRTDTLASTARTYKFTRQEQQLYGSGCSAAR